MTKRYQAKQRFILLWLLLGLQILGGTYVQATEQSTTNSPFVFEPVKPGLETRDQITLTVSGAQGEIRWQALKGEIRGSGNQVTYIAPGTPDSETVTVTDAAGNTDTLTFEVGGFIDLQLVHVLFLLIVGFIGGLVSGFAGASGAFILTPAMMSMGVPAIMAIASNMCHKFPEALVSAVKRTKSGQVDIKLGLVLGISAIVGVLCGALIQTQIKDAFGNVGSNLYVSVAFVVLLVIVGGYALRDAWKMYKSGNQDNAFKVSDLARWVQSVHIPGTMMYFPSLGTKVSVLFTIPVGFATGVLGATTAVGGFIAVPAMMYVLGALGLMASTTQLVIAFFVGISGTIVYALDGFVDIRLAMIILAGSFFGLQLGAIGTTYVKDYMIKIVMGVIMIFILLSLSLKIPVYLSDMGTIDRLNDGTLNLLERTSFAMLVLALTTGAVMIFYGFIGGYFKYTKLQKALEEIEIATEPGKSVLVADDIYPTSATQLSPIGRFEKIMVVTDGSDMNAGAVRESLRFAQRTGGRLSAMSVIMTNPEHDSLARQLIEKETDNAIAHLETVRTSASNAGVECDISVRHGIEIDQEIVDEAEQNQIDVIVMGSRGLTGLMRLMMGSNTAKVIGHAQCSVLIVPKDAQIEGKKIMVAIDGSRYSDVAAGAAISVAKHLHAPILVVAVVYSDHKESRYMEAVEAIKRVEAFMSKEGITVEGQVLSGRPAEAILEVAKAKGVDLIVVGSHGRTGLDKMLMGSVSERVIGYADCAILVVKA